MTVISIASLQHDECPPSFGDLLFRLRKQKGLSREVVAAGMSGNRIYDFERGIAIPRSKEIVENIAWALSCTTTERKQLIAAWRCSYSKRWMESPCACCPLLEQAYRKAS